MSQGHIPAIDKNTNSTKFDSIFPLGLWLMGQWYFPLEETISINNFVYSKMDGEFPLVTMKRLPRGNEWVLLLKIWGVILTHLWEVIYVI